MAATVAAFLLVNVLVQAVLYRWRLDDVLTAVLDLGAEAELLRRSSMGFALYGTGAIALVLLVTFTLLALRPRLRRLAGVAPLLGATAVTVAVYVDTTVFKDHGVHFYEFDLVALLGNAWLARDLGIRPQDLALALSVAGVTLVLETALFVTLRRVVRSRPWIGTWSVAGLVLLATSGLGLYGVFAPRVTTDRSELLESLPLRPVLLLEERARPHLAVVPRLGNGAYPVPRPGSEMPLVSDRKNLVFFLADGFRADHLRPELAQGLLDFATRDDVIAPALALSTGHATEMGFFVLLYGLDAYHYHPFTLARVSAFPLEVLRASGYVTAFVSGSRLNKYPTDFMAEAFDQVLYPRDDEEIFPLVQEFLKERRADGKPYFLLLFFYTPHYPFDSVKPWNRRFEPSLIEAERRTFFSFDDPRFQVRARNSYRNSVIQTDEFFRRTFTMFRSDYEAGRTALLATSDHGTEFWEHGLFGHGRSTFWREKIEVPLLIGLGGGISLSEEMRRTGSASLKDVWPTLFDLLGMSPRVEPELWSDGLSLLTTAPDRRAARADLFVAGRYFPWADRPNLLVAGDHKWWFRVSGLGPRGELRTETLRATNLLDDAVDDADTKLPREMAAGLARRFWHFLAPELTMPGQEPANGTVRAGVAGSPRQRPRRLPAPWLPGPRPTYCSRSTSSPTAPPT